MTLNEFIERVKLENSISIDTEKLEEYITDQAESKAKNGVCCFTDEEVKDLIINCKAEDLETTSKAKKEIKKEIKVDESNNQKQNEQVALF